MVLAVAALLGATPLLHHAPAAPPTWEQITADERLRPPKIKLLRDLEADLVAEDKTFGSMALKAGDVLDFITIRGDRMLVSLPGRVTLPGIDRSVFAADIAPPQGDKPGAARFAEDLQLQVAKADGSGTILVSLRAGAGVEVTAASATALTIRLPQLACLVQPGDTDVLAAAAPIAAEVAAEDTDRARLQAEAARVKQLESGAAANQPPETVEVSVHTGTTYQTIEGFGTCLITWDAIAALYQDKDFQKIYAEELGFSVLRCELAPETLPEPVKDPASITPSRLVIDKKTAVFTSFGKDLRKHHPDAKIIGTVWSPPAWMKENNSVVDTTLVQGRRSGSIDARDYKGSLNRVKKDHYKHFAQWMAALAKLYEKEGAPLYAVSPGNEVLFNQWYQSCVWTGADFAEMLPILRDALDANGLTHVKIFGPETMTGHDFSNQPFLAELFDKSRALKALDAFATHAYLDGIKGDYKGESSYSFWNMIKKTKKPFWITEGGTGGHFWPEPLEGVVAYFHNNMVQGQASLLTPWQVTDSEANEHGLMVRAEKTKKTYTAMHYGRFIRPGAVRVRAVPADGLVRTSAFTHAAQGTTTVVLVNPHPAPLNIRLRVEGKAPASFQMWRTSAKEDLKDLGPPKKDGTAWVFELPAHSIATLQGR